MLRNNQRLVVLVAHVAYRLDRCALDGLGCGPNRCALASPLQAFATRLFLVFSLVPARGRREAWKSRKDAGAALGSIMHLRSALIRPRGPCLNLMRRERRRRIIAAQTCGFVISPARVGCLHGPRGSTKGGTCRWLHHVRLDSGF
jgi:hypothetical protein